MIAFPRIHIAESALNRIANALEGDSPLAMPVPVPVVPDPQPLGLELDRSLAAPPPPVSAPPGAPEAALQESAQGGSPFGGILAAGTP